MRDQRYEWYPYIPLVVGQLTAYLLIWKGKSMGVSDWVAVGVSVLGVFGTISAAMISLKRDSKTIDGIHSHTEKMSPQVDNIEKTISNQAKGLNKLLEDLNYRKRLEQQSQKGVSGTELVQTGIGKILEEFQDLNHQYQELNRQHQDLNYKYQAAQYDIQLLRDRCHSLEAENKALRTKSQQKNKALIKQRDDYELEL